MSRQPAKSTQPVNVSLLAALMPFGADTLTVREVMTLLYLDAAIPGQSSVRDIASALKLNKPNVTRACYALVERGLIRQRKHPVDGRLCITSLTPKGSALAWEAKQAVGEIRGRSIAQYWISTNASGKKRWWASLDHIPEGDVNIRSATPDEAALMSQIEQWQAGDPPAALRRQLQKLMKTSGDPDLAVGIAADVLSRRPGASEIQP